MQISGLDEPASRCDWNLGSALCAARVSLSPPIAACLRGQYRKVYSVANRSEMINIVGYRLFEHKLECAYAEAVGEEE